MTIELQRSVTTTTKDRYEVRTYYSGVDVDAPLEPAVGRGCGMEARHFWFTFYGERYHALAYIYTWVNRAGEPSW